ncbi:MAG TPA: phosphatidylserine decarboxylase family protein [candidate division Zixibacteria bacterium]|nr:phosphatidylserine decarboxylase family protein [candidate division Zixibacteria bacterium]
MRPAPEGLTHILPAAALAALSLAAWLAFRHRVPLYIALGAGLVALFLLYFFRDPERRVPEGAGLIISPADGRVVVVAEVDEPFFIKGRARQVSVFMSPLDVHVNRAPVAGRVAYKKYHPGKFLPAYKDKASLDNEQMHLGIETAGGRVLVKQIAGALARRVICHPNIGDEVAAGQRMGLIKLGSRLDVMVPTEARIEVRVGDRVRAGETAIGGW